MKGAASWILIVLGIILIFVAILWWAIAVNAFVKLPDDIDSTMKSEGDITYYVDPTTQQPLAAGEELVLPMEVERRTSSIADEYDSSKAVIEEDITVKVAGMQQSTGGTTSVYVLDRKDSENVDDERAYDFFQGNTVNRDGSYYPLLPFDTSKDEKYPVWKGEIGEALESEFLSEEELEGVTVYNFHGSGAIEDRYEVTPAYLEVLGLPTETTFDALKPQLAAMGVDVDNLIALANQRLSAEDLQALNQALQEKIPLKYYWTWDIETSIEPKTGTPVDVYKDVEGISMEVDTSKLAGLSGLVELQGQMAEIEPQKVFEYNVVQTDETVKSAVEQAKDGANSLNLVKVYIPWALLIVGALILIVGLLIGGGQAPPQQEES